eukprot:5700290-Amphidinium_carterae.2
MALSSSAASYFLPMQATCTAKRLVHTLGQTLLLHNEADLVLVARLFMQSTSACWQAQDDLGSGLHPGHHTDCTFNSH